MAVGGWSSKEGAGAALASCGGGRTSKNVGNSVEFERIIPPPAESRVGKKGHQGGSDAGDLFAMKQGNSDWEGERDVTR